MDHLIKNTDEYLAKVPKPQRDELERIRKIVKRAVPEAEETISYGMPAFKFNGQPLIYFAAFKNHLSIFPTSWPVEALKDKLKDYKISKGTIQFTLDNPISESIIKELIILRLQEISKK
jgi:uncharacterized protein YdhG (YjbR/CyaY superfamily)